MIRIKKSFPNINMKKNVNELFSSFLKFQLDYVIVHGGNLLYAGVIYKKDIFDIKDGIYVEDLHETYSRRKYIIDEGNTEEIKENARKIFRNDKSVLVVPVIDKTGKVLYCIEKDIKDKEKEELEFFSKYTVLQQFGYSIGKWLKNKDIKSVNLIGGSQLLVPIYNDLRNSGIAIKHIIDHQFFVIGDMESHNWGKMKDEDWNSVDGQILLYLNTQHVLRDSLKVRNVKTKIWSILDIVNTAFAETTQYNKLLLLLDNWIENGIRVEYFRYPRVVDIKEKNKLEKYFMDQQIIPADYRKNINKYEDFLLDIVGFGDSIDDIDKNLINLARPVVNKGNVTELQDINSKYINVIGGKRVTTNIPQIYHNKIHVFGPSWVFGLYEQDYQTIASQLQKYVNADELNYKVINYGVPGLHWNQFLKNMNNAKIDKGDIVIIIDLDNNLEPYLKKCNVHVCDNFDYLQRPHTYGEVFADRDHLNANGVSLFAKKIYEQSFIATEIQKEIIIDKSFIRDDLEYELTFIDESQRNFKNDLNNYLESLPPVKRIVNGSIVMNCNPFTKGHRYLIETAAKQVDTLYIFVVEEDKSIFPFEDRLMLVKEGTKDLSNVVVIPSGKFIISSLTFPDYFTKEDNKEAVIDTSMDLSLFGEKIAPRLEITKRFAGHEPNDPITAQYNMEMARILPEYEIEFVEIQRKEMGDSVISASRVRKLLKEENFDEISKIVPDTTLTYLKQNKDDLKERMEKKNK